MAAKIGSSAAAVLAVALASLTSDVDADASPLTVLYAFQGGSDGSYPVGGVIIDHSGNLIGTTSQGGSSPSSAGAVFELTPKGRSYSKTTLWSFSGADGSGPNSVPLEDASGNLFQVLPNGGQYNYGTLVELSPAGSAYQESALYSFGNANDGRTPNGPPLAFQGNLFTTTLEGNTGKRPGESKTGTLVEFTTAELVETSIFDFSQARGTRPQSLAAMDVTGALYGGTQLGGSQGCGVLYKFVPTPTGGAETVLWDFQCGYNDGAQPFGNVVVDSDGDIYGVTVGGGQFGDGALYELIPSGQSYKEKILHSFRGQTDGIYPTTGLILVGDTMYGATYAGGGGYGCNPGCGTIFSLSSSRKYHVIHRFAGSDGQAPQGILTSDGQALYGTAIYGGTMSYDGLVYRMKI